MLNFDAQFNLYSIVLLFGTFQGLLYGLVFAIRGTVQKRLSDALMSALLLLLCLAIVPFLLGFIGSSLVYNELLFFPFGIGLLIGPVIYFYLKTQTNTEFRFKAQDALHLVPYGIYLSYHFAIFFRDQGFVQQWISSVHLPYHIPSVIALGVLISNYIYLFRSVKYYYEYQSWLDSELSDTEDVNLSWYRNYLYLAIGGVTLSWGIKTLDWWGIQLTYTQSWWEYVGLSAIIFVASISAFNQPQVIYLEFKPEEKDQAPEKPLLDSPELERWRQKALRLLEEEKIYLNPKLTLSEMAEQMGVNNNLLSQVINKGFGKNFNQLINDYRIEAFKAATQKPANGHLSILAIAMDCGFNSKATFNRVFKKAAGISPKEYLNNSGLPS
ncbi:MAG: AraC family transcriptional regulator [Bacteroidota bacterium]